MALGDILAIGFQPPQMMAMEEAQNSAKSVFMIAVSIFFTHTKARIPLSNSHIGMIHPVLIVTQHQRTTIVM
jgi:hypothetical protein